MKVTMLVLSIVLAGCVAVPVQQPVVYIQSQCRPPYVPKFDGGCWLPPVYYNPAPIYTPYPWGPGYFFYYYRR